jgi:hypothetical protein
MKDLLAFLVGDFEGLGVTGGAVTASATANTKSSRSL